MADQNPSILSHVSLGSNRFDEAAAFYDAVLTTLGCVRIMTHPGAIAWGREYPEFWLQTPIDGRPAGVGNGTHVGFFAADKASVEAFHKPRSTRALPTKARPARARNTVPPITAASSATWTVTRSKPPIGM